MANLVSACFKAGRGSKVLDIFADEVEPAGWLSWGSADRRVVEVWIDLHFLLQVEGMGVPSGTSGGHATGDLALGHDKQEACPEDHAARHSGVPVR